LRDAMTTDSFDPLGIYFGTRSGQLFGSRDEGKTWEKIMEGMPSVVCVRTAVVEDESGGHVSSGAKDARPASSKSKKLKSHSGKTSRSRKKN